MTAIDLLVGLLIAIGSAIIAVLGAVGVSSVIRAHQVRREPLLAEARQAIVVALSGGEVNTRDAFTSLNRFSKRHTVKLMLDLAPSVTGASRLVLLSLGEDTGVLERARNGVHSRRWSTRLYAARVLTAFGVKSDEMCLLLRDPSPEVRAQAAAWSVVTPNSVAIERLISLLDDPDGLCRFAAQDALIRIGLAAADALICALETANEELTGRILRIAAAMGDERFYGPAFVLASDSSARTRALATSVMARTGNPSAGEALVALLDDRSDEVVLAAAAGLAKLSYWPGAADVEPLLSHASWKLRQQAGLTLLAMGAPGMILLRASAPGSGPAAEMADRALQVQTLSNRFEAA
jgi:hypothetical protein